MTLLSAKWPVRRGVVGGRGQERPKASLPAGWLLLLGLVMVAGVAGYLLTGSLLAIVAMSGTAFAAISLRLGAKTSIGILLLLMPLQYIVIALLQFSGFSRYEEVSALKEAALLCGTLWLARSVRLHLTMPDVLLGCCLLLVSGQQLFQWNPRGLRDDWEWALLYVLGRVLILSPATQALWAKCAVWMCAALAVVGICEVQLLGPAPRTLLLQVTSGLPRLPSAFLATGYSGMRAASTMDSPLAFSGLCMIALLFWWVYLKRPYPAIFIAAGLIFTVTRSAVLGTVGGILAIAAQRREGKRFAIYGLVAMAGLLVAVPTLDLSRYLAATVTAGADTSEEGHKQSIINGFHTMLENPFGTGAGSVGPRAYYKNEGATHVESSFLTIGIEYGIAGGLLYAGFVVACLVSLFRLKEPIGYAASGALLGYGTLLTIGPIFLNVPLACWVWVPVGMGITRASQRKQAAFAAKTWEAYSGHAKKNCR